MNAKLETVGAITPARIRMEHLYVLVDLAISSKLTNLVVQVKIKCFMCGSLMLFYSSIPIYPYSNLIFLVSQYTFDHVNTSRDIPKVKMKLTYRIKDF